MTTPGELLLVDMGVENRNLYTADVTRTLPVRGRSPRCSAQVYDIVLRLAAGRHGRSSSRACKFADVHQTCMRVLAEGLNDLGILPGQRRRGDGQGVA